MEGIKVACIFSYVYSTWKSLNRAWILSTLVFNYQFGNWKTLKAYALCALSLCRCPCFPPSLSRVVYFISILFNSFCSFVVCFRGRYVIFERVYVSLWNKYCLSFYANDGWQWIYFIVHRIFMQMIFCIFLVFPMGWWKSVFYTTLCRCVHTTAIELYAICKRKCKNGRYTRYHK